MEFEQILNLLSPLIAAYGGQFGIVLQIVAIIGTLRVVMKPLVAGVQAVVAATPSASDDVAVSKVLDSKIYKAVTFALDWIASLKFPQAPKQ